MLWFRSNSPAQEALVSANANLKKALDTQDRKQALKFCRAAKKDLKGIKASANLTYLDQIVTAYREHGRVLVELGFTDKAIESYNAVDKLEQKFSIASSRGSSLNPPRVSPICQPVSQSPSSNSIHGHTAELVPAKIFAKDYHPQLFKGTPPKPDEKLTDIRQLAFCLALLQASPSPYDSLDEPTRIWLHHTKADEDEQERLKTMATDLLIEFVRDGLKDENTTAEITCIAPVLESDNYRSLLGIFVDGLKHSALLPIHALEGLDRAIKCAAPGSVDPDDLINILEHLKSRLQVINTQSKDHVYRLTHTVSHILDAMVDSDIKDLDREKLHTPLLLYSKELRKDADPYMVFQAAYAFQALLRVPDGEKSWQTVLRHTGTVVKGTARLFGAAKSFNVNEFIDTVQGGLEVAAKILERVGGAYKDFSALKKSGQELGEALKASFNDKHAWYEMLRGIDTLLQNGELTKVKTMICDAPCRLELAFQWGVCQRLGSLAADPIWDADSRENAVAFLGEIYRNDAVWGQEVKLKQCIIDILMQLASTSSDVKQAADRLLQEFENDIDLRKRAVYDASQKEGPGSHLWMIALPVVTSSLLLDRVQKTPAVEADLRKLGRLRLQDLGDTIYIAPEAKAHRQAADHDLFDLTSKAKEFLDSEKKVLLIWGDSGAGKSTFNKELEKELWNDYNNCEDRILRKQKKIPIFVTMPAIEKPEPDLIGRQLRKSRFSDAQIQELKAKREFILICDGYDEYQQMRNLYDINQLNQPGQWSAQMVITCRSEYLGIDYHYLFQPKDRDDRMGKTLLQEAVIAPFSKEQIKAYTKKYVARRRPHREEEKESQWEVEDYLRTFDQIPSLQELVTNPFLLTLSLQVLPGMAELGNDLSSITVTRVILYDRFIDQWVEQGKERLIQRELVGNEKKVFDNMCADGFSRKAILFVKKLAVAIFEKQDGIPVVEYSSDSDHEENTWKVEFFGQDDGKKLLREACPLHRYDNQHRFIHKSVLEYCLARAVFEPQLRKEHRTREQETTALVREGSKHHGQEKEMSITLASVPGVNSPLFKKSFVNKPAVLQFLAERVSQEPVFKQQLYVFIEYSKADKRWCTAAANAITILIRAGVKFNGEDLRGIQIPGADLSGGEFDSAQLQGADLQNVNLRDSWLRQANFSSAQMSGVQFGELPYLMEDSGVLSCAYSPDGTTIAVGLYSGRINVYDTTTLAKIYTLKSHSKAIQSVIYSPSGHQIASRSQDDTIQLWDTKTGAPGPLLSGYADFELDSIIGEIIPPESIIHAVKYSPSGRQVASLGWDNTVRLWNTDTGASGPALIGHTDIVSRVSYSPNGYQIASGSLDGTVRLWDAQSGAPGLILSGHTSGVTSVTYSPGGRQIVSGSWDDTVRVWDAQTGAPGPILRRHAEEGGVISVIYSPNGNQIASLSYHGTVRLWNAQTGALGLTLSGHADAIFSVTYSPCGHQIVTGGQNTTLRLWDAQTGAPGYILSGHTSGVTSLTYSPSGHQIASGSHDKTVRLWDPLVGAPSPILSGYTDVVTSVAYSPSGHQIASGSHDGTVRLWDAQSGAPGPILSGHTESITSVTYSPNGHQIASGSHDITVRLWNAHTGAPGPILSGHINYISSIIYSSCGRQIVTGSRDTTVRLWDTQTGVPGHILSGHTEGVNSVAYSPSGHQIASGSQDKTVRLWDAQTGRPGPVLSGHTEFVTNVAYSPSGDQIASGSHDRTVRLWNAHTGAPGPILSGHAGWVTSVTYSPSGCQIVAGGHGGIVRLWDTQTGAPCLVLRAHTSISPRMMMDSPMIFYNIILSLTYSPSGRQIASVSWDGTVRLWDVNSGRCLAVVEDFPGRVSSVAWKATLDGTYFTIGCDSIRTWKVIEEENSCQIRLHWRSKYDGLSVLNASIQNAHGLSPLNIQLLKQRGAVGEPTLPPALHEAS